MNRIGGSRRVWLTAKSYCLAAKALSEADLTQFIFPIIVNYAFSCELAIKSAEVETVSDGDLQSSNTLMSRVYPKTKRINGHSLVDLFNELSPNTQDCIQDEFLSKTGNDLLSQLKTCENYFVEARYHYKNGAPNKYEITELEELAEGLLHSVQACAS